MQEGSDKPHLSMLATTRGACTLPAMKRALSSTLYQEVWLSDDMQSATVPGHDSRQIKL